jgi:hypothetical protein
MILVYFYVHLFYLAKQKSNTFPIWFPNLPINDCGQAPPNESFPCIVSELAQKSKPNARTLNSSLIQILNFDDTRFHVFI